MESHNPALYTSSSDSAPCMMLPEHVDGYIDLPTLADIHRFLSQSGLEEDQALAAWVKARYLYEPTTAAGREIRTTEGFSKLDHAYRRVRSLTNKAQDKWPFFDRKWKQMSSTTVRNNARGESAPGVSWPGMNGLVQASLVTTGHDARQDKNSPAPSTFVPCGTKQSLQHHQNSRSRQPRISLSTSNTPIPLKPSEKIRLESSWRSEGPSIIQEMSELEKQLQLDPSKIQDRPKHADLFLRPEGSTSARSESAQELESEGVKAKSEEHGDAVLTASLMSDACQTCELTGSTAEDAARVEGGGKVRGPDGRYVPKPGAGKLRRSIGGAKVKRGRKSEITTDTVAASGQTEATSSVLANPEKETVVDVAPMSATAEHSGPEKQDGSNHENLPAAEDATSVPTLGTTEGKDKSNVELSERTHDHLSIDVDPNGFTPAYLTLAAEAEAVSSNLDKLPPNSSRKNKRKTEAVTHSGPPRKRGRPRKVDVGKIAAKAAETATEDGAAEAPSAALEADIVLEEEPPRMVTRRTSRRSAALNLDPPTPAKPDKQKPAREKLQQPSELENETMVDVDEDTTAGPEASSHVPITNKPHSRPAQSNVRFAPKTQSKANVSSPKDASPQTDADLLPLGQRKRSISTKRFELNQPVTEQPAKGLDTLPNDTSTSALEPVIDFTSSLTKVTTSGRSPQSGIVNGPTKDGTDSLQIPAEIEYFARVHTSTGIVEIPMSPRTFSKEAEVVQRYAEWLKTQGSSQVSFETFKSIFCIAKNG